MNISLVTCFVSLKTEVPNFHQKKSLQKSRKINCSQNSFTVYSLYKKAYFLFALILQQSASSDSICNVLGSSSATIDDRLFINVN